jgi:hypothetical protein
MRRLASLLFLLALSFSLPVHPQLGAPLGRCGPQPRDSELPQNQLPVEQGSPEARKRPAVDMVSLQRDAQELAELSASIPADLQRVNHDLFPKDMLEKLKRVEKLSKHLRSELTR